MSTTSEKLYLSMKQLNERLDNIKPDAIEYKKDIQDYEMRIKKLEDKNIKLAQNTIEICDQIDMMYEFFKNIENKNACNMVSKIQQMYTKLLNEVGIYEMAILDKEYNPNFEECISIQESKKEKDIVIEVCKKAYVFDSKILRNAQVKLSK